MKSKTIFSLIFLLMVLSSCVKQDVIKIVHQDNSFTDIGKLSLGRYGHASVTSNNDIFIIGGMQKNSNPLVTNIEKFDVVNKSIETLPTSILGRRYLGAVIIDSDIYIVGGEKRSENLPLNSSITWQTTGFLEKYDLNTHKVITLAEMPNPRQYMGIVEHGGRIYVIGGSQYKSLTSDHFRHKTRVSLDLPYNPQAHLDSQFLFLSSMDIYDIKSNTWIEGPSMPTARQCKSVLYKNRIYVIGGYDGYALDNVEVFDIEKNVWEVYEDSPVTMSAYSCLEKNGLIYFFGDYEELDRVMIYNPKTKEWFNIESNFKGCRHNASITCNDDIYILGGNVSPKLDTTLDIIQKYGGI